MPRPAGRAPGHLRAAAADHAAPGADPLGPAAWGVLTAAQVFALLCALLIEFGFDLSSAREAARRQTDRADLGHLLSGITTAKLALTDVAALLTLAA
ncbi:hypothetical protein [Deinococcus sp. RIT780]|uniref:hypothetical protein n=1 Tax=Deinococcus sp. RIT780 TaxID=2870472 RepID=UPI001C8B0758|nr:hypothetical protein [Deinococcus sp. RIT780]MBX8464006.1 hypothetical protein [Deinococcus sp. RIT780]